jgi:hypothetical protein
MDRGALADEFFRLAHDDVSGHPRLSEQACGLALAAGLIGELLFLRRVRVRVRDGRLEVHEGPVPPDPLSHAVLEQIAGEPEHADLDVRLRALGHDAHEQVAHRLWRAGHVERKVSILRFGRGAPVWRPTDINTAAGPRVRVKELLRRRDDPDHFDAFLIGLAVTVGLRAVLLQDGPSAAPAYLDFVCSRLHPAVRLLLDHTQAAVGRAVLVPRP